jgi:CHAT domain-containing protein/Tfp pilus assembly protein PilF
MLSNLNEVAASYPEFTFYVNRYLLGGIMNFCQTIVIVVLASVLSLSVSVADDKTDALNQQALAAYQQGDYAKSAELTEQVLAVMRQQVGEKNPDTVIMMANLAQLYQLQGRDELAKPLFEKTLSLNLELLGEKHPDTLSNMNNLAELYSAQGAFDKAEPLLVKTLKIRTEILGEKHKNTLISMNNLANLYRAKGRYDLAEPLFLKALSLRVEILGKKHPDTLLSMNNLAGLYTAQGRYELAEPLYKEDLLLSQEVLGEKHPDTLVSLNNLARLYQLQGHYDLAEPLFIKNLQLCKEVFGEKHKNTISSINNLAVLYKTQGRYEVAQPLFEQALQLNKDILGDNHPVTLISMNNLANLYKEQEKYNLAQPLYEQAVQLSKNLLGEEHPDTIERIANLAGLYELQQQYNLAKPLYQIALQLSKKVLGEKHPDTLLNMNNLAWFYFSQQQYKKAEPLLTNAVQISESLLGEKHPNTLTILANLAQLYQATEQWNKADKLWQEHFKNSNRFLNNVLWGAGEKTRFFYLQQQENIKNNYLTFYSSFNSSKMAEKAFNFSLARKGQLLKIASEVNALSKNSQQPDIKALSEKFTAQKQLLSNLILSGKASNTQKQELEEDINKLEMQLSQKVSGFQRSQQEVTPNDVLKKLSNEQVLVDFLIFKQVDFKKQCYKSTQLIALIADKKQGIVLIKLGDMQTINTAIKAYRQQMLPDENAQKNLNTISQNIYNLIWQPLLPYLVNKTEVYLIPDGILHLLPFKALMDKHGHYLAESKQITLLTSARELVLSAPSASANNTVIFAAPAFGDLEDKTNRNIAIRQQDIYFAPLQGAVAEGKAIDELIKTKQPVTLFQDQQATETMVAAVHSPRFLHFATHGFFLENLPQSIVKPDRMGVIQESTLKLLQATENPLMRSGLALTGANFGINGKKQADGTDGILTALEVLALNLEGTDLVTLSACETGVGDIQVGEGVYSLNRAFQEAGAKAVLSTLWSVADEQTKLFMQDFYDLVLKGNSPQRALQKTQLKFLHNKNTQHPFFWAAFTVVGI